MCILQRFKHELFSLSHHIQPISGSHRFVMLVWTTPKVLTFAPQYVKSSTMLNLNPGANGDFAPSTTAQGNTPGGAFTTVSALLHGKFSTILGTPIIGSYFYVRFANLLKFTFISSNSRLTTERGIAVKF